MEFDAQHDDNGFRVHMTSILCLIIHESFVSLAALGPGIAETHRRVSAVI